MEKMWNISAADAQKVTALQAGLGINPAICEILVQRGQETFEQAKKFFRPSLNDLHDPWLMKDMDKAVERVLLAMQRQEKILVFGDYDVDGTTSVATFFGFLRKHYNPARIDFYIPHRYREGYGVSKAGIDFARDHGFSLIISLDCGIKSADLVAYAAEGGVDFIICDHHLPDDLLPPAIAILNPKQKDCNYPYKELCGCGIGFKLMCALAQRMGIPESEVTDCLDLVATAIAADIVPLTGENRTMAWYGLKKANASPNHGIKALMHLSGLQKELHIGNLVFMIAPRINAAGRMDDARKAVQMFIAPTYEEALTFANLLHADNTDRKEADSLTTEEALAIIEGDAEMATRRSTVVFQPHWHKGVVGIVASRLIERHYRPTVVLTQSGEILAGSARSVRGFNLYEAIHACREHLLGYGGHFAAAGMTLQPDQLASFILKFEDVVAGSIAPGSLLPELVIDATIRLANINVSLFHILSQMEPFGPENTRPVFIARRVMDTGYSKIAKGLHIRFSVRQDNVVMSGIGFNLAAKFPLLLSGPVDLVFTIDENEWNGEKRLQLKVIDLRSSGAADGEERS